MHASILICSALLGLSIFGLGFYVSMVRARTKDIHSAGDDPAGPVMKAVRAHANATEYVGVILALFILVGLTYSGRDLGLWMSSLIIGLTLARFLHAFGMITCKSLAQPNPFRFVGALFTYLLGTALTLTLLAKAVI